MTPYLVIFDPPSQKPLPKLLVGKNQVKSETPSLWDGFPNFTGFELWKLPLPDSGGEQWVCWMLAIIILSQNIYVVTHFICQILFYFYQTKGLTYFESVKNRIEQLIRKTEPNQMFDVKDEKLYFFFSHFIKVVIKRGWGVC